MNLKLKHKKLYALLVVLCLVLSVAVLLTACGGNKNNGTTDENDDTSNNGGNNQDNKPGYEGGPEQGEYYYNVAGGEILLTLTKGNFTLKGPGYDKSGTYSVDGTTMALVFSDNETATATIADNTVVLNYNATMTFLKKIPYTVTFNVNGGSSVAPMTVVNGKTATKPQDPTKSGYVFLGWYTDSALTTSYSFATPVTADTTLYAKWIEAGEGPVYSVSFNLGYEGAPAIADVTTVNGLIYNLPENPTRTGYKFAGWWISMFEDGEKLTYKYNNTKLTTDTTLYALWVANDAQIAPPEVNVTANGATWTPVTGANNYRVTLKDSEGNTLQQITTVKYDFTYNFGNQAAGAYSIEVVAVGNGGKTSDVAVRYFNNKALDRVSGLTVVDGKLVFTAVANAEKYIISIDCGNKQHTHTALDNGQSTYFDFSNCSMQNGGIKFTVTAAAEGYANSTPSKVFVYEQNLAAMAGVTYDAATDSFTWTAVANATGYKVVVTVGANEYTFKVTGTSFSLANYTGAISVAVTPVADGYNSPVAATASATKTAPASVQNLAMSNTTLTWTATADSYKITVNGKTYTTTETTFDLASKLAELNLTAGETYTVSVVAVAGSEESAAVTVSAINGAMGAITYSNKVVSWPAVIGYSNFQVRVNGGEAITVTGKSFASVVLTKAGENVIEVICTDLTTDWANASTVKVTAYAVKYVTRTTDGGEVVEYLAVGDTLTPPTGLTANGYNFGGWYNTPLGAEDNGKEYTEATLVAAADLTLYTNWIPKSYKVTLNVDNDYITNITNGSTEDVTYTKDYKLPVPVSVDESKGFFVGWFNAPNGAGLKMTDDLGNSVEPYGIVGDSMLYPYFAEALSYIEVKNNEDEVVGYYVTKGLGISNRNVSAIIVPAMYNGKPIVGIADNAFHSCYNIVSVDFPNTVEYVGKGAFELCNKLLALNMYEAVPGYETPYSTHDGALMYYHATSGETYLEVFPSAKVGEYTVADTVDVIGPGAFQNAKISKVIISTGVTTISKNAFVNCNQLTEIEFAFGREIDVSIEDGAFADTPNVTKIVLPAKLARLENIKVFDVFEDLAIIEIEAGGAYYSSVNNLICDPYGTKLLYVPRSFKGTFEVPLGITHVDDKLFYENPYITKVIIGEHVEAIGANAFYNCTGLTEVVIKTPRETIFMIGADAFNRCTNLKSVTFEGSDVTNSNENLPIFVNENAFANCSKLTTVSIGENVVIYEISTGAFSFCSSLENFHVDSTATLKIIGQEAFKGCSGLTKFEIHGTTKEVGNNAFEGCTKLNTISLGEGTNNLSLGKEVFKDCIRLSTIELPASLNSFDSSLFDGCENIQNINVDTNNTYLESVDGVLYTKGQTEIIYYPRTRTISGGVVDLTSITNLKKIGPSVFKNNPQVVTVKLGAGVEEIAKHAFENCINLTSVQFAGANANFVLGSYAFAGCSKLTSFELPASTTRIGSYAFDHSALASFTIPASVNYIGYNAFAYTNIETISIPASVTVIGHGAFYHAAKLSTVTFEARTADIAIGQWDDLDAKAEGIQQEIEAGTFVGTALTSIEIPATATYIGAYAFNGLKSLATVTIPTGATLETIDAHAFDGTSIASINLNQGLATIGEYAFANTKLTSVYVPKSVQYIKGYAFSISTLTSVTFEEGSNEGIGLHISNGAFVGADLTSIHLPAQLKAFGEADEKYGFSAVGVFYGLDVRTNTERFVDVVFNGNMNLTSITVSPENIVFGTVDGVLYKLQSTVDPDTGLLKYVPVRLLFSPMGNLGNNGTVTVPKTVTMVDYTSFLRTQLSQIIFEEYDKEDANYGLGKLTIGYYDASKTQHLFPGVITSMCDETKPGNDRNHTNLTLIQFPSHLSKINYGAFYGITSYVSNKANATIEVKFNPDSYVKFGASAFRASTAIKSLELPKVTYISQMAFYQLSEVTSITFAPGSTATSVGDRSFADCSKLTAFELPASIKIIEQMAFMGCSKLESFTVEEGSVLESISAKAFQNLGSQTANGINFVIPVTVESIGTEVFRYAKIIELTLSAKIILDANGSLIEGCTTIEKIHVPEEHETLSSFEGIVYDKAQTAIYMVPSNWNEDQFIIPDTVQVIAAGMFANFKGSYVKLPAALTSIAAKAFQYAQITHIEIPDNVISIGDYAFNYCEKLTTITISNSSNLKYVGDQAFSHAAITSINLPDSVETIGYSAFESCSNLKYFKSPAKLTSIEGSTFKNCTALATIELNEGLEIINNSAFVSCAITSIVIPNSVTRILDYAFNGCKNLKTFYCSDASILNYVGFSCFYNCTGLETVTFAPSIKNFGRNAQGRYNTFYGCTNLKEINLPAEMVEIPDGFFANLTKLETITLPTSLETLGAEAFYNCPKLTTVIIPASVKTAGNAAFAKCTSLTSVVFEAGSALKILPANMFAECTALTSITLPDGLIEIGESAFAMTAFTEINLPATLEEIGDTAFFRCEELTALNVPASVLRIGNETFAYCSNLTALTLNSGIKYIGSFAFAYTGVTNVTLPDSLTNLEGNPFLGCADIVISLDANNTSFIYENGILLDETGTILIYYSPANTATSFTLPLTVSDIAAGAFANSKLETIVLHERIKVITTFAFAYSESLKSIVIPGSVTSIDDSAFAGCSSIESITIPKSVTNIGNYAFANCTSLSTFTLEERKDDIKVGSHLFYGCASITKTYEFPGVTDYTPYMYAGTGITSIVFADNTNYNVEGVFADSALTSVTFGEMKGTMNMLGKAFFAGTKLTSITVPEGFYCIGESAFKDCENLVSVTISNNTIEDSAFENCTALTTVTVVKPSYVGGRDEFTINLYDRAFANAVSLSNTNMFEFVYAYGVEALLNCSAITGEISLSNRLNMIEDYAFSGMTVSKITLNGREYWLQPYSLAGLTEATTVYFATATSAEALTDRMGGGSSWFENATAKLEFFTPNNGEVKVTLTEEEEKWLEVMVEKGEIDKSMMDSFKEAWLAYKGSFVTLYPSEGKLSEDEMAALKEFCEAYKIGDDLRAQLEEGLWTEYKKTLAKELTKHPKYFTSDELAVFDELAGKMDEDTQKAFKQAWFEYKINFNETNPSDEITKEDMALVYDFCNSIGLSEDFANELINRWPEYKKQLAAELATANPVLIDLTEDELNALMKFSEMYDLKESIEEIKLAWMAYKGAFKVEGKGDAENLNAEEEALVQNMVDTYGLKGELVKEYADRLLQYKQEYAMYFTAGNIAISEKDGELIKEFVRNAGLEESVLESVMEDLLAYKKDFCLSGFVPGKELSDEENAAYMEFMSKYGVDAKTAEKMMQTFMDYRLEFAAELGRDIRK